MLTRRTATLPPLLLLLALIARSAPAQNDDRPLAPIPPPPENRILDEGRIFAFDQPALEATASALLEAATVHQVEVYVAAYSFLLNETIDQRAQRLQKAWLDGRHGVIIVYNTSTGRMTFSSDEDIDDFLPQHELLLLFREAAAAAKPHEAGPPRLKAAVDSLLSSLIPRVEAKREVRPFFDRGMALYAAALVSAIVLLAAAGLLLLRLQNKAETRRNEFFYFPNVEVGPRYGAPNGGGAMVELSFHPAPSPRA